MIYIYMYSMNVKLFELLWQQAGRNIKLYRQGRQPLWVSMVWVWSELFLKICLNSVWIIAEFLQKTRNWKCWIKSAVERNSEFKQTVCKIVVFILNDKINKWFRHGWFEWKHMPRFPKKDFQIFLQFSVEDYTDKNIFEALQTIDVILQEIDIIFENFLIQDWQLKLWWLPSVHIFYKFYLNFSADLKIHFLFCFIF